MAQNLNFNLGVETNAAVSSINEFFQAFDSGAAKAQSKLNTAFGQKLKTEVEISLKNGELVAKKIQSSKDIANKLKTVFNALNGELGRTPGELKKQLQVLKQLRDNTQKFQKDTKQVTGEWRRITTRLNEVSRALGQMSDGGRLAGFLSKLALVQTAANLATAAIMGLGRSVADLAGTSVRMEVLALQLKAFTGSTANAEAAFKDFVKIAGQTPFNVEEVANAGKIMMAFGISTEEAIEATRQLSIVSAATGGDVNLLARNLGQIAAQGQAYTRDLTQFAIQGIPIWNEMSKVTGKSVAQLKKMAAEGAIGFEIVSEALTNMTAEGSKFAKVADDMQTTFSGRLALIESAFQLLAKETIQSLNKIDQAFGGIVSGAMINFANGLKALAENMDNVVLAALDLAPAFAAFTVALTAVNYRTIVGALGAIVIALKAQAAAALAAMKAQYGLLAAMGPKGWAIIAGAAGVTALAIKGVTDEVRRNLREADRLAGENESAAESAMELAAAEREATASLAETERAIKANIDALELKKGRAKIVAKESKEAYDIEKKALDSVVASVRARIDAEISANDELRDTIRDRIEVEKQSYDEITNKAKLRYDAEKTETRNLYDEKLRLLDLEADKLNARTPSEQKLYDLEKKQLQAKIKSGGLEEEDLLRAKARLERMNRQEQLEKNAAQRKEIEIQKADALKKLEEERQDKLDEIKKKHEEIIADLEAQLKSVEEENKQYEQQKSQIDQITSGVEQYNGRIDQGLERIRTQAQAVSGLETAWQSATAQLAAYTNQLAEAKQAQAEAVAAPPTGGAPGRATGGPVTGGSTYTVNELGKEAFLAASGKLSMINSPSFGKWKAPGAGTVIPAHLTKQLNVPTGGVNLNKAAAMNASSARGGAMGSVLNALKSSKGSDTFNQTVTIQSSNPVQAANNVMVEMARLKHRKFR